MTDRTCLDVAVDAYAARFVIPPADISIDMRAALDAIHPALADLTPDDVAAIFALVVYSPEGRWVSRTDLAADGDRLHARCEYGVDFQAWAYDNWPAIAAVLRERDEQIPLESENERLRVRAETAEADADRLFPYTAHRPGCYVYAGHCDCGHEEADAAHTAIVEARHAD